jgi:hypothetical protein
VAEDHILYDLGRIPTVAEALEGIALEAWMCNAAQQLSQRYPHIEPARESWAGSGQENAAQ